MLRVCRESKEIILVMFRFLQCPLNSCSSVRLLGKQQPKDVSFVQRSQQQDVVSH